jgi:AcrR family transcriptional regulator
MIGRMGDKLASRSRRDILLDQVADHVYANGLVNLSLRDLANVTGTSNRTLLYYFGSKDELLVESLVRVGERTYAWKAMADYLVQRDRPLVDRLDDAFSTVAPAHDIGFARLFFHVFGYLLFEKQTFEAQTSRFRTFAVADLAGAFSGIGLLPADAEIFAHRTLAHWRGLQVMQLFSQPEELVARVRRAGHEGIVGEAQELVS